MLLSTTADTDQAVTLRGFCPAPTSRDAMLATIKSQSCADTDSTVSPELLLTSATYAAIRANIFHRLWWSVRHACSPSPHAEPTRSAAKRRRNTVNEAW